MRKPVGIFFFEVSALQINSTIVYNKLREQINDQQQVLYFTPHVIQKILKGLQIKSRRKYADFAYKLVSLLQPQIENIDIINLCVLFDSIASLKLQSETTHKKMPQILVNLKDIIFDNVDDISEHEALNIIKGYLNAPKTLDISLLIQIRQRVLGIAQRSPQKLKTKFLIEFLANMVQQREGVKLKIKDVNLILGIFYKRIQSNEQMTVSFMAEVLEMLILYQPMFQNASNFNQSDLYKQQNISYFHKIAEIICQNIKPLLGQIGYSIGIKLLTSLYKLGFQDTQMLNSYFEQYHKQLLEKKTLQQIQLLYLLSYPERGAGSISDNQKRGFLKSNAKPVKKEVGSTYTQEQKIKFVESTLFKRLEALQELALNEMLLNKEKSNDILENVIEEPEEDTSDLDPEQGQSSEPFKESKQFMQSASEGEEEEYLENEISTLNMQTSKENYLSLAVQFGFNYSAVKSECFMTLHHNFYNFISQNYSLLPIKTKAQIMLTFIHSRYPDNLWAPFLIQKAKELSCQDLMTLIVQYEETKKKTYQMFDLLITAIYNHKEKLLIFKKTIDLLLDTPTISLINTKGTPHHCLKSIFDFQQNSNPEEIEDQENENLNKNDHSINCNIDYNDQKISITELIKVYKLMMSLNIENKDLGKIILDYIVQCNTIENLAQTNNYFILTEIGLILTKIDEVNKQDSEDENSQILKQKMEQIQKALHQEIYRRPEIFNTLSIFNKYVQISFFVHKNSPSIINDGALKKLSNDLLNKIQFAKPNNSQKNLIDSILLLKLMEAEGYIPKISGHLDEILQVQFQAVLQTTSSLLSMVPYLPQLSKIYEKRQLKQNIQKNEKKQIQYQQEAEEWEYFRFIKRFYQESQIQKMMDNVIIEYLRFFIQFKPEQNQQCLDIINSILKDIFLILQSNPQKIRPNTITQLLNILQKSRIFHEKLIEEIIQKCLINPSKLQFYQQEAVDIILDITKLGCVSENWGKAASLLLKYHTSNLTELLQQNQEQEDQNKNSSIQIYKIQKPFQLLWSMLLLDIYHQQNDTFKISLIKSYNHHLNNYSKENAYINRFIADCSDLVSLFNLQEANKEKNELSNIEIIQKDQFSNLLKQSQFQEFEELIESATGLQILNQNNGQDNDNNENSIFRNFQILDDLHFEADLYFVNQKIAVLYETGIYVNIDRSQPSGHCLMRNKIAQKIQDRLKLKDSPENVTFITVNKWKLNNLQSKEEKIIYLQQLGIPIENRFNN